MVCVNIHLNDTKTSSLSVLANKGCVCIIHTLTHKHEIQVCKSSPHNTSAMILAGMRPGSQEQQKVSFSSAPPECAPVQAIPEI